MRHRPSRCETRACTALLFVALSVGVVTGTVSPLRAQTAEPAPAGQTGAAPAMAQPGMNQQQAPVQAAPIGRPFGFTHNEYVDLSETYETNPLGLLGYYPNATSGSDTFTALSLGIGLHDHTARFTGDLQYAAVGAAYARFSGFDQITNYLTALATAAIIPDYLLLRASAFAAPILANALGPLAAPGVPVARGVNTGMYDTYGYNVSPDLAFRLGNFARSDTILAQSAAFFVFPQGPAVNATVPFGAPPSQLTSYQAVEQLSSGSDFNRLNWQLTGAGARFDEAGIEFQQLSGTANIAYAISREFALLATAGYDSFTSNEPFTVPITGPVELGGFRISLGPRLQANFEAGEQFHLPSYISNIYYQMTPATTFSFSLTDAITTPAAGLLGSLGQLGVNNQGNFYNTGYGLGPNTPPSTISNVSAFDPGSLNGAALTNVISRFRYATGSLVHIADRMQYRLTGFWLSYDPVVQTTGFSQQTMEGADIAVFRNINPYLSGAADIGYTDYRMLGANFSTISGNVTLTYQLSALTALYFRTAYIARLSSAALIAVSPGTTNMSDTAITLGIRRQF